MIVICFGEKWPSFEVVERKELEKRLNDEYYGPNPHFYERLQDCEGFNGLMVIDGPIVKPHIATKVTEWKF